jgi:dephospho-CoA kinase
LTVAFSEEQVEVCYNVSMSAYEPPNVKILAFVGMSGSGKSSAVGHLTERGIPKVYFGGIVLKAMQEQGLELTQENEKPFREDLRVREGKDFIAKRIIKEIYDLIGAGQHRIVADGLYTWTEYKLLKQEFHNRLTVVAVTAPRELRYDRLGHRPIRPLTHHEAHERDYAEIENLEKGGPIAIADYTIVNDKDLENMHAQIDALVEKIEFNL